MKILAPLLVAFSMVCFTAPNGLATWIDRNQIVSLLHAGDDCPNGSNSKLTMGNGTIACIHETIKEALSKLDKADSK